MAMYGNTAPDVDTTTQPLEVNDIEKGGDEEAQTTSLAREEKTDFNEKNVRQVSC